jgi:hypothetical protein
VIGETLRRRKELIERRLFDFLAFAVRNPLGAGIQVLCEERPEIEFVKRVCGGYFRNFFSFLLEEGFVGITFGCDSVVFGGFVEHGIGHNLLIDHFPQFQTVQRQHADHLHQAWCEYLFLSDA